MKHAILQFRDREVRAPSAAGLGRLSLITGSLGPGGAERQLTRLSIQLERARKAGEPVGGIALTRPVEVVVRSHGPEKQNDFFLRDVQDEGVELYQLNHVKPVSPKSLGISDPELLTLLDYLPPSVNYGVKRLTPHLIESKCDTASVWQDGACLFAGLAALLAGVPHIQLCIRGLPPSLRRHMFRPEYEPMYRAMAQVPGVTFLSNSRAAARAYSEWLDIPLDRFAIVYNGVPKLPAEAPAEDEAAWQAFIDATPDATHTIGGVFRFDTDKQPTVWIRFAARYLKQHPNTRMLLVGGGRLLEGAQELARELRIADRILFTGRSNKVPFWMSKMDVLLLLSRYEGLPNVLIEAQYMGVRVVTTPAGGAPECLIEGTTGHVLECCEKPCLDNIVRCAKDLADKSSDTELFADDGPGRHFLDENFSVPRMLANFVQCAAQPLVEGELQAAALRAA
jgi:glycosyltransferase involved in cell wall biosynthesis